MAQPPRGVSKETATKAPAASTTRAAASDHSTRTRGGDSRNTVRGVPALFRGAPDGTHHNAVPLGVAERGERGFGAFHPGMRDDATNGDCPHIELVHRFDVVCPASSASDLAPVSDLTPIALKDERRNAGTRAEFR